MLGATDLVARFESETKSDMARPRELIVEAR
jgi:hypothetical protein